MKPSVSPWDFNERPLLVFWETTRACQLVCKHCRAEAINERDSKELGLEEAQELLRAIRAFGSPPPILVLTGGDILMRPDALELIARAAGVGLKVAVAPSVTPLLTETRLEEMMQAGVEGISISLDGAGAATHDGIRGVDGTFEATVARIREAVDLGMRVQVNTAVMRSNISELPDIFHIIKGLGVAAWEVFFLIKTGRGAELEDLEPWEYEEVAHFLYDASFYGVQVRTTEGPHFRRVVVQRQEASEDAPPVDGRLLKGLRGQLRSLEGEPDERSSTRLVATGDARGIVFINHQGYVYPSGFLPIPAGNVRRKDLTGIYRQSPFLRSLRSPDRFKGRCGRCRFKELCGGSRSRAFSAFGDPLAEDPACIYQPV
ncbi:MAG: TIGR04053 family radical SAM/SPASM domain-containing protein [Thermoplasmata archaeon]